MSELFKNLGDRYVQGKRAPIFQKGSVWTDQSEKKVSFKPDSDFKVDNDKLEANPVYNSDKQNCF